MIERMATRLAILVALASCLLASCDTCGPTPAPPAEVPACTGPVTVSVSGGLTPTFTWEPDCMIGKLIVIQGGGGPEDEYWATETRGTNTYRRPIVYGIHPPGAVENQIPQPMTPGDPYTVWVFRWISSHPDSLDTGFRRIGAADFVPRADSSSAEVRQNAQAARSPSSAMTPRRVDTAPEVE